MRSIYGAQQYKAVALVNLYRNFLQVFEDYVKPVEFKQYWLQMTGAIQLWSTTVQAEAFVNLSTSRSLAIQSCSNVIQS